MARRGDIRVGDIVTTVGGEVRYETDIPHGTRAEVVGVCSAGCCIEIKTLLVLYHTLNYDVRYVEKRRPCMFEEKA